MSDVKRELLDKLRFELAFIEDGGYGRSVRTPHKPTSPFQDSLTCLNFGDPLRSHPCGECILMQYVPESGKSEDVPCHHIPLDDKNRTIATWMRLRPRRLSSSGFAKKSTNLKESWLLSREGHRSSH